MHVLLVSSWSTRNHSFASGLAVIAPAGSALVLGSTGAVRMEASLVLVAVLRFLPHVTSVLVCPRHSKSMLCGIPLYNLNIPLEEK